MAGSSQMFIAEGSSMNKPPAFTGDDYPYWADRMEMYIKSTQYRLWNIITKGDIPITKEESEWTSTEYEVLELNNKARYAITCALSRTEYNRFCSYKTAKTLWDALKVSHEGTEDVRLRKAATLQREYEMFSMKKGESIDSMFGRFQTILNGLTALGTEFTKAQNNMKILDSLPAAWEAMSTAISVGRDMKTLTLDELIGALRVHEVHLSKRDKSKGQESIALQAEETCTKQEDCRSSKSKSKILKAEAESSSEENSENSSDDEISLMARRFKKIMMKKGRGNRFFNRNERRQPTEKKHSKDETNGVVCYECRKPGHIKAECPKLRKRWNPKKDKKKKSLLTWEDLDSSSSESTDEETANICLMADTSESSKEVQFTVHTTDTDSSSESESDEEELSYDTLLANSQFIALEYKNCKSKLKAALANISKLKKENEILTKNLKSESDHLITSSDQTKLLSEVNELKKENESLRKDLTSFIQGTSKLNMLLKHRRHPNDKTGLGFNPTDDKNDSYHIPILTCRKCGKEGHMEMTCKAPPMSELKACMTNSRKNHSYKKRPVQKKRTRSNKKGPKKIWVPKSQIIYVADILNRKAEGFKLVPGQWMLASHDRKPIYVPRPQTK